MKLDPRHLEILSAIVEQGSVSGGAEALNKSQSSVSRSLQLLQDRVGIALFEANRKPLIPTEFCRALAVEGEKIARAGGIASGLIRKAKSGQLGSVRVTGTPFFMDGVVSTMFARFQAEFPEIKIEQTYGYVDETLVNLKNGMTDLGILPIRESEVPDHLCCVRVLRGRNVVACRNGHKLSRQKSIRLSDIAMYNWVGPPTSSPLYHDLRTALESIGVTNFKISFSGGTLSSVVNILSESDALAVLPYSVMFNMRRQKLLHWLPIRIGDPDRHLCVIYRKNALQNRTIQRLLNFIDYEFKALQALISRKERENIWRS